MNCIYLIFQLLLERVAANARICSCYLTRRDLLEANNVHGEAELAQATAAFLPPVGALYSYQVVI